MTAPVPSVGDRIHVRVGNARLAVVVEDVLRGAEMTFLEVRAAGANANVLVRLSQVCE